MNNIFCFPHATVHQIVYMWHDTDPNTGDKLDKPTLFLQVDNGIWYNALRVYNILRSMLNENEKENGKSPVS